MNSQEGEQASPSDDEWIWEHRSVEGSNVLTTLNVGVPVVVAPASKLIFTDFHSHDSWRIRDW